MRKPLLAAAMAVSLASLFSLPAYSQDHERRHDEDRGHMRDHGRGPMREDMRRGPDHDRDHDWHHEWRRGDRLPAEYRHRQYVVEDWRGHGLNRPPRGYQWVQVGGDYVLVAIGSGVIANIIVGR
jgi:Ni/Co efflux regulator RcnB